LQPPRSSWEAWQALLRPHGWIQSQRLPLRLLLKGNVSALPPILRLPTEDCAQWRNGGSNSEQKASTNPAVPNWPTRNNASPRPLTILPPPPTTRSDNRLLANKIECNLISRNSRVNVPLTTNGLYRRSFGLRLYFQARVAAVSPKKIAAAAVQNQQSPLYDRDPCPAQCKPDTWQNYAPTNWLINVTTTANHPYLAPQA
jgi:hypothetical protein